MTMSERIDLLDLTVGGNEEERVLAAYLRMAGDAMLNKMYAINQIDKPEDVPAAYHMRQVEIAAFLLNKRGAEGETQHIENGIHRNYQGAYIPDVMFEGLVPFIGLVK